MFIFIIYNTIYLRLIYFNINYIILYYINFRISLTYR